MSSCRQPPASAEEREMASAIDLLKADHQKVKKLLAELVGTTNRAGKTRTKLLAEIKKELQIHTTVEEEIFYPEFKRTDGSEHETLYHEATEEHRAVDKLVLPDLEKADPTSHAFHGRARVLQELIEHHAEEEEQEMFPKAAKTLSNEQLGDLGRRIEERKRELAKRG
jgi:hemerythrin superfamily protein